MVGKCPNESQETELMATCGRISVADEAYSHLMDIPVLSLDTNRTYVNIFCARCHGDAGNLQPLTLSIDCNTSRADMQHR